MKFSPDNQQTSNLSHLHAPARVSSVANNSIYTDSPSIKTHNKLRIAIIKALLATVLALIFSGILTSPFSATISSMFSSPERGDFRLTDLYAQVADSRPMRELDKNIVLIDIGQAGREKIAEAIEILSLCDTKAIGVDINFAVPKENDSILLNAIAGSPGIVFPVSVKEDGPERFVLDDRPFFYNEIVGPEYGVVNLVSEREGASIRDGVKLFNLASPQITVPSFAMAMLMRGAPTIAAKALSTGSNTEVIDYASREFLIIPIEDLEERVEELTGRYVLIGSLAEAIDMHSTPIDSYMAGMLVHAYWLATLLKSNFYSAMPVWIDYLLAGVVGFLIILTAILMTGKLRGITIRIIQVSFLIALVLVGYTFYIDNKLVCNFSHTLLILVFCLFALDVFNGIDGVISWCVSRLFKKKR